MLSHKHVSYICNSTESLNLPLQPEEMKTAICKLQLGPNFETLKFASDFVADDFWCPHTDKELQKEGLGPSTMSFTISSTTKLNESRIQQAKLMNKCLGQLQTVKIWLPASSTSFVYN